MSTPAASRAEAPAVVSKSATIRSVNEADRTVDFIASTDAIDSYGESVSQENWQLDRYLSNPVALFAHCSRELPIGHATRCEVVASGGKKQLECTIKFATAEANPLAEQVWQSLRQKTLRAVSVGFMPHTVRWEKRNDNEVYVLDDCELYEISVTPVPANPEALAKMRSKARREGLSAKGEGPAFDVGDTVSLTVPPHMDGQGTGEIREAVLTYAYGIVFEGMEDMGVHHWYVESELKPEGGGMGGEKARSASANVRLPEASASMRARARETATQATSATQRESEKTMLTEKEIQDLRDKSAENAALRAVAEKAASEAAERLAAVTLERDANANALKSLTTERDALAQSVKSANDALATAKRTITENEVDGLIGKKFAPTEREVMVELAVSNPALYAKTVAARPDMKLTENLAGNEKATPSTAGAPTGDAFAQAVSATPAT